jgi:long-chain acyl-CoA synthetase
MTVSSPVALFNCVYEALLAQVNAHPKTVALEFEGVELSYDEFLAQIDNAARKLSTMGITAGKAFAAFTQNRPEILVCYYAASKIGAIFVPLNPNLTASEVTYAFQHSGSEFLLCDDLATPIASRAVELEKLQPISRVMEAAVPTNNSKLLSVDVQSDFLIIYTSGSTGTPKAIVLSHASQLNAAVALSQMWGLNEKDVTVVGLPLGYLYGLSTAAAAGLQAGGKIVILRRFHPRDALESLVESKATVYHGVPTMYSMMLEYCEQRELHYDLSQVRQLICAGAPLPAEMRERFSARFAQVLYDYYAMTECTPVFGAYSGDLRSIPKKAIGRLAPGASVKILRADGTHCNVREIGEILVRGAATMKRYHNSPELTESTLIDGYVRSGDLGFKDESDYYYISGRMKDVIIRGGANISPSEVEKVLIAHPGVQDAAVVGVEDRIFGEVPMAFIINRHGYKVSEDELVRHCEKSLSDFKVPRRYLFTSDLPMGKTGKVDKAELKRRAAVQYDGKNDERV